LAAGPAQGWEADSTHAGITEQAAGASTAHGVLVKQLGRKLGWYDSLTVPRAKAPELYQKLDLLEPSSGFVPDARGRQSALAGLLAGSVLEDLPATRARNHFYDPMHKTGLSGGTVHGLRALVDKAVWSRLVREDVVDGGVGAPDWIFSPK